MLPTCLTNTLLKNFGRNVIRTRAIGCEARMLPFVLYGPLLRVILSKCPSSVEDLFALEIIICTSERCKKISIYLVLIQVPDVPVSR